MIIFDIRRDTYPFENNPYRTRVFTHLFRGDINKRPEELHLLLMSDLRKLDFVSHSHGFPSSFSDSSSFEVISAFSQVLLQSCCSAILSLPDGYLTTIFDASFFSEFDACSFSTLYVFLSSFTVSSSQIWAVD